MWISERLIKIIGKRKITFGQVASDWLYYKRNSIKLSTYSKYSYTINKYLLPKFKKKTLSKLKNYNFNEYVSELKEELSPKTIRDIICILKAILYYAEEEHEAIFKKKKMVAPKIRAKNITILSRKEKRKLEKECLKENSLTALGIILALNTGLRVGEICALKWRNIDLEKRTLHVKYTLQRIYDVEQKKTKIILDTPKTDTSARSIPISNKLYDLLQPIKSKYDESAFFLTGSPDIYIEPRRLQYIFKDTLSKNKMRKYKFHILRHTFATDCIEVGMDVKSLSEILGHSSVDITLNRYVHSSYKTKKKFLERL